MNVLLNYLSMLFACLFLSTAVDKLRNWKHHLQTMKAYDILPHPLVAPFHVMFVCSELIVSLTLFLKGPTWYNQFLSIALFVTYTAAIAVNLYRGHRNIDCGCGGFLNSEDLHVGLIVRNVILMLGSGALLFFLDVTIDLSWMERIATFLLAIASLMLFMLSREANKIKEKLHRLQTKLF
ncbi:MauE/DoxX family redox-associated membrane protein [Tumebacillus lipolyticus]|uniref:MauE/DoxX family redox-associated membrane protein n=1 Tax=Tumebacillus lipolyticus TaxID=1280370 RepID=A0ABW4ZWB9_9BACL